MKTRKRAREERAIQTAERDKALKNGESKVLQMSPKSSSTGSNAQPNLSIPIDVIMRLIFPFAFDTFYEGLQLATKVCVCIWRFAMGKKSMETGVHFWTPFLTRLINERRRLHPGLYGNVDRYQMWPKFMMDTGDFIKVLSSKFKPYWLNGKDDLRVECFRSEDKEYCMHYLEKSYWIRKECLKEHMIVYEYEVYEKVSLESHDERRFILRCEMLRDIIGSEVFEFEGSKDFTLRGYKVRLNQNGHMFRTISWDDSWKEIELAHVDGWSARIDL